jgi:ABC-type Fe3+ transport system permease subunit
LDIFSVCQGLSLFQISTYSVEIFSMYNAFHDSVNGIRQTFGVIVLAFAVIVVWWIFVRARISHTAFVPIRKRDMPIGWGTRLVVCLGLGGLLLVGAGLPLGMLIARISSFESLFEMWHTTQSEWFASLLLASLATAVIVVVSGTGAFLLEGVNRPVGLGILGVLVMPYLISGPGWGIALISFWNQAGWRAWVYDHSVIAVVACVGKYLFVGWLGFSFALRSVRQEYKDAAQVFGLSGWRQFSTITLPLIAPYIAGTGAVVFLLVLGEVDSLLLVSPPGFTTVPVRVYGLMHYGPSELVSSMAVLMVLVIGGIGMLGILARGE